MSAVSLKRGPGRPAGDRDTRAVILDVAEQLFADVGYVAASTREIAQRASVSQAMITYYFRSKQELFEAVFKRRGLELGDRRLVLLDELEARTKGSPSVSELIRAYLTPQFDLRRSGASGMAFVRLQARLHHEPEELAFRLRREVYDASAKRYIAAIERARPDIDPADLNWRMAFLIGAYLYMLSKVDRLDDLSGGRYRADDIDELVTRLTQFLSHGMEAPSTQFDDGAPAPKRRGKR